MLENLTVLGSGTRLVRADGQRIWCVRCGPEPLGACQSVAVVLGGGCVVDDKSQDFDSCVLARIDRGGVHPFANVQPPCGEMDEKLPSSVARPREPIAEPGS